MTKELNMKNRKIADLIISKILKLGYTKDQWGRYILKGTEFKRKYIFNSKSYRVELKYNNSTKWHRINGGYYKDYENL